MLAALDTVDWNRLTHAYGSAADVPGLLRALDSPDGTQRDAAMHALYGNIFHQGSRYEASAAAVTFLLELAGDGVAPARAHVLALLSSLAIGYDEAWLPAGFPVARFREWVETNPADLDGVGERLREWLLDNAVDRGEPIPGTDEERRHLNAHWELVTYDAVRRGVPLFRSLLTAPQAEVRALSAYLLAWFPEHAADSVAVLLRAALDPDGTVSATARVALGLIAAAAPDAPDALDKLLRRGLADDRALVRWGSAVALARRHGPASPAGAATELRHWAGQPGAPGADVPFLDGDVAGYAAQSLPLLGSEDLDETVEALLRRLPSVSGREALSHTEALLRLTFADAQVAPGTPFGDLSAVRQRVLRAIADAPQLWRFGDAPFVNFAGLMGSFGLPSTVEDARIYIALD